MVQRLDELLSATSGVYFDAERVLASHQSAYQRIEIFETPDLGRLMRIDGANMTSDRDEFFYHEALVHPAACAHPAPQRVLIVGGGDGGSSEEALKHSSVALCRMCELDQAVVDMSREWLPQVHKGVFDNPRLHVQIGDGMAYLANPVRDADDRFDLIYLDLTDPVGPAEALYAPPFFADCKRALNDGGALTLHIGSPFSHTQRVQQSMRHLRQLFKVVTPYFVHIPIYGATWGFAVASDVIDISKVAAEEVDARLASRQVAHRQLYTGAVHHAMLTLPPYIGELAL
jgi:spermidine synthase